MDEEDEGSKFCEEDIDQILLRRTHTITIESEGKGSTFAKVRAELGPGFLWECGGVHIQHLVKRSCDACVMFALYFELSNY